MLSQLVRSTRCYASRVHASLPSLQVPIRQLTASPLNTSSRTSTKYSTQYQGHRLRVASSLSQVPSNSVRRRTMATMTSPGIKLVSQVANKKAEQAPPVDLDFEEDIEESSSTTTEFDPATITPDTLTLDATCIDQLKALKTTKDVGGLRITVDTGGCSGFQYLYSLVKNEDVPTAPKQFVKTGDTQTVSFDGTDFAFEHDSAVVLVDDVSMPFLRGAVVEYKVELIRAGFAVRDNPNVDLACGCGTSFAKKS